MMTQEYLLKVENLTISLDLAENSLPIVQNISFSINPGRVFALVGESGSGKTVVSLSLLQLLGKGVKISTGKILFRKPGGEPVDIAAMHPTGKEIQGLRGAEIGMIFQEPMSSFSPVHTIGNQVEEVIRLHMDLNKKQIRVRAIEMLRKVGITDPERAIKQYPFEFSGGMRQRAMIARALACNPALLIADEPTTALDVTIQAQILKLMKSLQSELNMANLFISHNIGVIAQIADDVAIMYMGKIVEQGPVRAILGNPQHPYTKGLLRAIPHLEDIGRGRKLEPIAGTVPSLYERPGGCPFAARCSSFIEGVCNKSFPNGHNVDEEHVVFCHDLIQNHSADQNNEAVA
ncbi:MAG: ABC transporter ATP-binding protein [Cohaesibacteraceae bacterium]|nr:ABC transporter ATP-binding protein [Cohaesibacteraceae bacterium]